MQPGCSLDAPIPGLYAQTTTTTEAHRLTALGETAPLCCLPACGHAIRPGYLSFHLALEVYTLGSSLSDTSENHALLNMTVDTVPIPGPVGLPVLGNLLDIDAEVPTQSFAHLAEQYGEIYQMTFPGNNVFNVVSSHALVNECCDQKRFGKSLSKALRQVRNGVHDGLFTAENGEPNWEKAHRVLTPAFGPMPIRHMFDEMHDIASQLALKWARHGPEEAIMVPEDFTRLALDTLALCAMGFRFNSFYRTDMHPFVEAMGSYLTESGNRSRRPPLPAFVYRAVDQKYWADIAVMQDTADGVLQARKEQNPPSDRKDLMAAMLEGKDPKTGEKLDDKSIINNLITFLIAGHETTSGMLSFAFYYLLRNPETLEKAQKEVDEVIGTGPVLPEHMPKLRYIAAILRETLRISATIPAIMVAPHKDELIGGKYFVKAGQNVLLLFMKSHLDPAVYGEDAKEFKPERMTDENFDRLNREFPNCWKPFGNGVRACIGRPFAWQESLITMAILLQNFTFRLDDPDYELTIKETMTFKPKDFFIRAQLRDGLTPTIMEHRLAGGRSQTEMATAAAATAAETTSNGVKSSGTAKGLPLNIYYGSNSGTCEAMADRLAADAQAHGFRAEVVKPLDAAKEALPTDRPVVFVTASYEGEPPDNAVSFVSWLKEETEGEAAGDALKGVAYAVFGCGNHDWSRTFHLIPKLVDEKLEVKGGARIAPIGLTDVAEGNMFEDFEAWEDNVLFPALQERYGVAAANGDETAEAAEAAVLDVEITMPRASALRQDVREAQVVATRVLVDGDEKEAAESRRKNHIEIELPSGMTYRAGDYLAVLPFNSQTTIRRAMRRFQLPWDANIAVHSGENGAVPSTQISPYRPTGRHRQPQGITVLANAATKAETKAELQRLASDDYAADISAKRVSILDLLERFLDVDLPFGTFLSLLPPMRVRQYSISSSPLWNASRVSLTYSVLAQPALSGKGVYEGVASNYLSRTTTNDTIHVAVRPSHSAFHLPEDVEKVGVIMVAAGAGLAPFRGFIQERAELKSAGRQLAPAMLFFGCRSPAEDLYRDELDDWEARGVVDVRRAYSRAPEDTNNAVAAKCRHVQHRLYHDRADVLELWKSGSQMYVCGSRHVGAGVKESVMRIHSETKAAEGAAETEAETEAWFDSMRSVRYAVDVFD
ncbi:cytochrome p450 monooxygenase [Grosmannia clavigera kw1407]|uniref:Cytochrome p450 monooxygenase n=1 Tax=Grosmannia clavigera (strain kw1407 / UAMH 11150) TaxID=655863 RepID=F0X884_GROCL|nr:cytochrome p450 monooxygenase [Grosmannia clavigera kw1407]EFX05838.1 cytochrome p450 monooxygenase [Grosmannia clavigera kw1407]